MVWSRSSKTKKESMNAAAILAFRTRVQAVEESSFPCMVSVDGGAPVPASSISGQADSLDLQTGGVLSQKHKVFRIRKALLATAPQPQITIIVSAGVRYRVETVNGDQDTSPAWLVTCNLARS